jgi:S1-C subfamily serine protease
MVGTGVVTASHVLAACSPTGTIFLGDGSAGVWADHSTHDLARVTYESHLGNPNPRPLQTESRRAYVGEHLALLGIPALSSLGEPFTPQVTVVQGTVVATGHRQVLTSADGGRELLTDAIQVASPGVFPGESGGPAVDSAGKVVGVIEGSGSGFVTLTPVTDLTPPH